MEITYYENSSGEEMVLITDTENNTSESMSKATYEERKANEAETI